MTTRHARQTLAVALAIGAVGAGCDERTPPPEDPVVRPVRYATITRNDAEFVTKSFAGISRSSDTSRLSLRVGGTLLELGVAVGDKVTAGQVLARVDASDLELQAQEANSALVQAKSQLESAEAEFARVRTLYENNAASRSQYDQLRGQVEQARAAVNAARTRTRLAKRQIDYARLVAPSGATVSEVFVKLNENVSPGQPVLTLSSGDDVEVLVNVAGNFVSRLRVGQPLEVRFKALEGTTIAGVVQEIGVTPRERETTFPVTAALEKKDPRVRAGMAAEVVFEVPTDPEDRGLFVPSAAVSQDAKGTFVFTVSTTDSAGKLGKVARKEISIDNSLGPKGIRVLGGLDDAEFVVTAGVSRLTDGQAVRMLGPTE